jgi:16S rRNA (cytosine1402-N4)-methyltransferase
VSMQDTHTPVMAHQMVEALAPHDGGAYLDGTFGAGGYSEALLGAALCNVWSIDRDPGVAATGADLERRHGGRFKILAGCYGDMLPLLAGLDVARVDGVALDLGLSSMQIDDAERGFSFRFDGPLDMRMESQGRTAADIVNNLGEEDLAHIIYRFGEERASRRIARAIVEARVRAPISRTGELADLVRRVVPRSPGGIDPATRTFQALRIFINDELGELERGLRAAETLLSPGGRLCVVSFHSLEDRRVKEFLRRRSGTGPRPSRHQLEGTEIEPPPSFRLLRRGAVRPSAREVAENPRARSARLRAAERTQAPPWLVSPETGKNQWAA